MIRLSTWKTKKLLRISLLSGERYYRHRTWRVVWILFLPVFAWLESESEDR
jgi:hypothetical protein